MKKELLMKGKWVDFVSFNGYEVLDENKKLVMILPIIKSSQKSGASEELLYGFRFEYCPPYMYYDNKERNWYTVISGGLEKGESSLDGALRELREEAGLIVPNLKNVDVELKNKNIPLCKSTTLRADIMVIDLTKSDVSWEDPSGDGTDAESKSNTVWLTSEEVESTLTKNCDLLMTYFATFIKK